MKDYLWICGMVIACILVSFFLLMGLAAMQFKLDASKCVLESNATSKETKMVGDKWRSYCMVNIDGEWVPDTTWRMIED